jgi:hypothetical protein
MNAESAFIDEIISRQIPNGKSAGLITFERKEISQNGLQI